MLLRDRDTMRTAETRAEHAFRNTLVHLNASRPVPMSAETFAGVLMPSGPQDSMGTLSRDLLRELIEDVPVESLHDMVLGNRTSFARLLEIVRFTEAEGENAVWVREMAREPLA